MKKLLKKDFPKIVFVILIVLLCVIRIVLCSNQMVQVEPEEAAIDDMLMFRGAVSITQGEWLGDYNWLTISKHMFFAIWLALLNVLHIPYLIGGHLLYIFASIMVMMAFKPILKRYWIKFCFLGVLLFNPVSWAMFNVRIYRDNIFPSLCMLCFAGVIGFCLRFSEPIKKSIGYAVLGGVGLATAWLTREDGIWVLPFVVCAVGFYVLCCLMQKQEVKQKIKRISVCVIPFAILVGGILAYSTMNYIHYGRFVVSDFTSGDFKAAIGAMTRCDDTGAHPRVFVPNTVRNEIYKNSPVAKKLQPVLETKKNYSGYGDPAKDEFNSGGFYWVLRKSAYDAGLTTDAVTAKQFYESLADELNKLCDLQIIKTDNPKRNSTMMRFEPEYIMPTIAEMGNSLRVLYRLEQTSPFMDKQSKFSPNTESQQVIEEFLRTECTVALKENTNEPYLLPRQNLFKKILDLITQIMRVAIIPTTLCALVWLVMQIGTFFKCIKTKTYDISFIGSVLYIGIFLSFILRVAMISYIEAVSFQIGTYLMYLSSAAPLMFIFAAIGTIMLIQKWLDKLTKQDDLHKSA